MNYDLEAIMVRELEGKFFWCPNVDEEVGAGKMATEIRKAQRQFFTPKRVTEAERKAEENRRLAELLAKRKAAKDAAQKSLAESLGFLRSLVAEAHGLAPCDIVRKTTSPKAGVVKHHFMWCLTRYYPELSIAELGRQVGKHHSTVIHGRNAFEALKAKHADKIAVVDEVMGYGKGYIS